ncbi:acyltransferase [Sphingomonas hengshuiensis]|uniref:acyltransferase n=1 Tax=Sphingomonas hengshuiensis TaxID=1609977 RepID=UPI000AEA71AE|nr:acyltransferase [Sphingomonas hengshuiensis]
MKQVAAPSLSHRILRRGLRDLRFGLLRLHTIAFAAVRGVHAGRGTLIYPGARLSRIGGGTIRIGRHCEILPGALLATYGGAIRIEDHVSVNPYSVLYGHGGLDVGEGTRIAAHVVVVPANHGIEPDAPIRVQPMITRGIRIGADVWIGAGVRILDGAEIVPGCVLAAGAVVLPSLRTEPMGIYGGVPARRIGSRIKPEEAP